VQSWDTANKATELSDYSVCTTWGVSGKDLFLIIVFSRRLEYPALMPPSSGETAVHQSASRLSRRRASSQLAILAIPRVAKGRAGYEQEPDHCSQSASGRPSPDHPSREDQVATASTQIFRRPGEVRWAILRPLRRGTLLLVAGMNARPSKPKL
jgi:hypothetical protein